MVALRHSLAHLTAAIIALSTGGAEPVYAASDADIDRLTTYATILGRATACGIDVDGPSRRVGRWIDNTFTGQERAAYLNVFIEGMYWNAQRQASGQSPDTCADVTRVMRTMAWP